MKRRSGVNDATTVFEMLAGGRSEESKKELPVPEQWRDDELVRCEKCNQAVVKSENAKNKKVVLLDTIHRAFHVARNRAGTPWVVSAHPMRIMIPHHLVCQGGDK